MAATSAPTATAAPAWWRSRASACSRPRAAASRRRAWKSPPILRALTSQKMVLELLLSDMPEQEYTLDNKLKQWAASSGLASPIPGREQPKADLSHPAIAVNLDACIQCTLRARLPRSAGERRHRLRRPRRALEDRVRLRRPDGRVDLRRVRRVRAGVPDWRAHAGARRRPAEGRQDGRLGVPVLRRGCLLTYHVKQNRILFVNGKDGPANRNRLCVKGRYGFDYVHHPHRLTKPLIRKPASRNRPTSSSTQQLVGSVPRSDVGEALQSGRRIETHQGRGPLRARGLRLRKGERGGVSLPEARAHRIRHQQRRPLHAPLPPPRWRRCSRASARARCRTR